MTWYKNTYFLPTIIANNTQISIQVLHASWITHTQSWILADVYYLFIPNVNTLRLRQNDHQFADSIHLWFLFWSHHFSETFSQSPTNYETKLVKIMAWCRISDTPLSDPILALFTGACMHHSASMCSQNYNTINPQIDWQWNVVFMASSQINMFCIAMGPVNTALWLIQ